MVDPRINLQLDPETRAPRTDEYSIGVDREVGRRLAVAVAYVRKDGAQLHRLDGCRRSVSRGDADVARRPHRAGVRARQRARPHRRFLLTNPDGYSLTYNGLVMAVEKRRSDGWQAFGSYTLSRASGLQASSGSDRGGRAGQHRVAAATQLTFGRDPNDLTNARGRLPNDRPHMFRVMGSVDVPRTGLVVAANLQYFSGKPWAATAQLHAAAGRASASCSSRAARAGCRRNRCSMCACRGRSRFGGVGRIELLLDVLNALNDTAEEGLATDNLFSPNFGQPHRLHGSASRDGRREAEPRPVMAGWESTFHGRATQRLKIGPV